MDMHKCQCCTFSSTSVLNGTVWTVGIFIPVCSCYVAFIYFADLPFLAISSRFERVLIVSYMLIWFDCFDGLKVHLFVSYHFDMITISLFISFV